MPWEEFTTMSRRKEFVYLAQSEAVNFSELCRRYRISRKTGYKWFKRSTSGETEFADRSRRPNSSPNATRLETENAIVALRNEHPAWGGRKLRKRLEALGFTGVPAASTITAILRRRGLIDPEESIKHKPWKRFEAEAPNELWQMDFKGHFEVVGGRCHPLTILDDHSRFSLCIHGSGNERFVSVRQALERTFRNYGLPSRMLVDNGPPWGGLGKDQYTVFDAWLIRLGIKVSNSGVQHPQTLGKDERFHRTLKAEVVRYCSSLTLSQCQVRFDQWRDVYNFERPHEAIGMDVPISRYRQSERPFPDSLPPIEYGPDDIVRKVMDGGFVSYRNREFRVGKAFIGNPVALRPTRIDGILEVFFCSENIGNIDFTQPEPTMLAAADDEEFRNDHQL